MTERSRLDKAMRAAEAWTEVEAAADWAYMSDSQDPAAIKDVWFTLARAAIAQHGLIIATAPGDGE